MVFFSLLKALADNLVYLEGTLPSRTFSSALPSAWRLRKVEEQYNTSEVESWFLSFSLTLGFKNY
jgi:hypothetical protein